MIGSHPIGSVPYGRAGFSVGAPQTVVTETATLQAEAYGSNIGLGLGTATANTSAFDAGLQLSLPLGTANAEATAFDVQVKYTIETLTATANVEAFGLDWGLTTDADAAEFTALNASTKTFLETQVASANTQAFDVTGVLIVTTNVAELTAEAFDISPIGLTTDTDAATIGAFDAQPLTYLNTELATAQASAFDVGVYQLFRIQTETASATIEAFGLDIDLTTDEDVATLTAFDAQPKTYLETQTASATISALDFQGIELTTDEDVATITAFDVQPKITLELGVASAEVESFDTGLLRFLQAQVATMQAVALSFEGLGLTTDSDAAEIQAFDADITYVVSGIPDIVVTRSSDFQQNEITVLNSSLGNVNIYRADDHRATFTLLSGNEGSPYTDSGLDTTKNYKYKASFVAVGTKGGSPFSVEGQLCEPRYTIGDRTL